MLLGLAPEGARDLASAMLRTGDELATRRRRIAGLLAEAGEADTVSASLLTTEQWLSRTAVDVRRRALLVAELGAYAVDPACELPWSDPLRRAWMSVLHNGGNLLSGAADSVAGTGTTLWQLLPVHDGWRQAWVDLGAGVGHAVRHPGDAGYAALGGYDLAERGHSYWLGSFAPDVAAVFIGGAGVAKIGLRAADTAGDAGRRMSLLDRTAQAAALRAKREITDGPDNEQHRNFGGHRPKPNPHIEPLAKARVKQYDKAGKGHSADRHGPETTLEQQLYRAKTGWTPDGKKKKPIDASRFFRWQDQLEAIERALEQRARRPPDWDEFYEEISFDHVVGDGYAAGSLEYRETKVVLVGIDGGRVVTSFPLLEKGRPA